MFISIGRSLQIDWAVPKDEFLKRGKTPDITNMPDNNMDVDLTNATDKGSEQNESKVIDPNIKGIYSVYTLLYLFSAFNDILMFNSKKKSKKTDKRRRKRI